MSLRYCVFKDCHNYFNVNYKCYSKQDLTFFQFPKDPQRRQKWMHLSKVQPNLPSSYYVLCSDHFDNKYKSKQHRRTTLVGEAVPNPHESLTASKQTEEVDNNEEYGTDEIPVDYYMYKEDSTELAIATDDNQEEQGQNLVESTTITDEHLVELVQNVIDSDYQMDINRSSSPVCEAKQTDKFAPKRKAINSISPNLSTSAHAKQFKSTTELQLEIVTSKCVAIDKNDILLSSNEQVKECQWTNDASLNTVGRSKEEIFENKTANNRINSEEEYIDPNILVDARNVTVFIFKGEEHVQMRKEYYVKEKVDLMAKLKKFENIIENIKNQCNRMYAHD